MEGILEGLPREQFSRQVSLGLRTAASSEEEALAASDRWVQALMAQDYATVRRLMEDGTVRVTFADQSYPGPAAPEEAAHQRRNLAAFLQADGALRQAQDSRHTAPEELRRAREDFDHAKAQFDPPFGDREL